MVANAILVDVVKVIALADVITPNQFEVELLTEGGGRHDFEVHGTQTQTQEHTNTYAHSHPHCNMH